jgi:hypothetical protein
MVDKLPSKLLYMKLCVFLSVRSTISKLFFREEFHLIFSNDDDDEIEALAEHGGRVPCAGTTHLHTALQGWPYDGLHRGDSQGN